MGRKEIKPSIIKELYAKCGNMCAFPECTNRLFSDDEFGKSHISNICHIQGYNEGSARYNPNLSEDEANEISNLILLCRNHHAIIDQNEELYKVDFLHSLKKSHEQKIEDIIYNKILNNPIINFDNIDCTSFIIYINNNSDYSLDKEYLSKLLKKLSKQKTVTLQILFKIIEFYYENGNINMQCICNETELDDGKFSMQLRLLENSKFIEEIYYDNSIRRYVEDTDGNVYDVSENYLFKMYNGTWQLKKSGYILYEILKYIKSYQKFYDLLVNLNLQYIQD